MLRPYNDYCNDHNNDHDNGHAICIYDAGHSAKYHVRPSAASMCRMTGVVLNDTFKCVAARRTAAISVADGG